jgi:aminomethyltransferase
MTEPAPPAAPPLRRTPLYEFHRRHGGHLVPFAGWEMPLYYTSILEEHAQVRSRVGLFDVGHMGIFTVDGDHAAALLARRTTLDVPAMVPGQVKYGFWLNSDGQILDDLLITRLDDGVHGPRRHLVVPNAGRADRILDLLEQHRRPDTEVTRHNGAVTILAIQGPASRQLLEGLFPWSLAGLKFYTARAFPRKAAERSEGRIGLEFPKELGPELLVSRTGYTGELGYELFVPGELADGLAESLVGAGALPCGLGARNTLRLEKGYLLSGSDFHLDRSPLEAGQERFVEMDHPFVGREALKTQQQQGLKVRLVGLEVTAPGAFPRDGAKVLRGEETVGLVTSGGMSPTLGYGIALAYVAPALAVPGTELAVSLRERAVPARVVALPFVPARPARPS